MNFYMEVAKLRAARKLWAKYMKERMGAKKEGSLLLRTHCQTSGYAPPGPLTSLPLCFTPCCVCHLWALWKLFLFKVLADGAGPLQQHHANHH